MASLFKGGKKSAQFELNTELPHFDVFYVGRSAARSKMGRECTKEIVEELVKKAKILPELQRVSVTITSRGIMVREIKETNSRETFIPIYDVTYGAADKTYKNVFTFVTNFSQSQNRSDGRKSSFDSARPFVCHAFYCHNAAMARAMVVYLVRAFKVGFETWKRVAKSNELRERIRAGPGQGSSEGETVKKSSSSGSEGTIKQLEVSVKPLDVNGMNNLSPRRTNNNIPPKRSPSGPPVETANHVDKVSKWLDKWLNVSEKKAPSKSNVISTSDEEKQEIEFSKRMHEFSNPDTLNVEIDIKSEMEDPEVMSVLEEITSQMGNDENSTVADISSVDSYDSPRSSFSDKAPSIIKQEPSMIKQEPVNTGPVGLLENKTMLF